MKHWVLSRYLIKEVGLALLAVSIVLVTVLLTTRLAHYLGNAARGELPAGAIVKLMGLAALGNLQVVLPASFFLGMVLTFGRLYRDSEMAALAACGVGPRLLYRSLFLLAVPLALVVGGLSLSVGPMAQRQVAEVQAQAQQTLELEGLQPGRFLTSERVDGMFYVESLQDGQMRNVFLQTTAEGRLVLVGAERARQALDPETGQRFLVLEDGYRLEGIPGGAQWRRVEFEEHGVRLPEPALVAANLRTRALPVDLLVAEGSASSWAELQWRLSLPLMTLVLTLLALPLSKSGPREGRYGKLLLAVIVFAVYSNLLSAAQEWTKQGSLPLWLGLWWVHGAMAALAGVWLARRFGLVRRPRRRRRAA